MGCRCHHQKITNWYELQNAEPRNPLEFFAFAQLGSQTGKLFYSTDYINDGGTWLASPITVNTPVFNNSVQAWNTQKDRGDATQWAFQHSMANTATDLAVPLRGLVFIRGGKRWRNTIRLLFSSACNYLEISFLDNAGTKGDNHGTVPVIRFEGSLGATTHNLFITTKSTGIVTLGLRTEVTATGDDSMFELRCIATE